MTSYYLKYVNDMHKYLLELETTDSWNNKIDIESAFSNWYNYTKKIAQENKNIYFIGNGASAMMASHMAADACKNGKLKSSAFNDPALLTAVSNDISYIESFALPISRFATRGDMLIAISSSGNSPNIVSGIKTARDKGMYIITVTGMKEENASRKLGDLNFYVKSQSYGLVESLHQTILHCWLDYYIENME